MRYFFILGNNPTLSTAELLAVFPKNQSMALVNSILALETKEKINADEIIKKIGGTIKIGIISYARLCPPARTGRQELGIKEEKELLSKIVKLIDIDKIKGKYKLGISYYGRTKFNIKPLGMEIKKYLRERGINCRWVTSKEHTLSSVVVEQNKLISKGIEIVLIENSPATPLLKGVEKILIGQTLAVQPFKELSFRDYGRPARDDYSGMLPPKLAQIMINLSRAKITDTILDPFCGSGTTLTEAILMGYKEIIGSDSSKKAVEDTRKNIKWIKKNYELGIMNYELYNRSVAELSKFIKPNSIDAIVTEPYLGPQRGKIDIKKVIKELENLYSRSLSEFKKVLKPDGRVVIIFPIFNLKEKMEFVNPDLNGFKIVSPIPENLRNNKVVKLTTKNTIIYGREGQKVWREIVILKNN